MTCDPDESIRVHEPQQREAAFDRFSRAVDGPLMVLALAMIPLLIMARSDSSGSVTTITTVGYGDKFPITAAGRGVAVALMIAGIALLVVITATIAAYFVEHDREDEPDKTQQQLESIDARLAAIEAALVNPEASRRRAAVRRHG